MLPVYGNQCVSASPAGDHLQHQRNVQRMASGSQIKTWFVDLGLKLEVVVPYLGKSRPLIGRCCQRCTPKSWESLFHKHLTSLGFCNAIKITEENTRFRGWLARRLCYVLAVWDWKFCTDSSCDLSERVFQSKRIQDVVSQKVMLSQGDGPGASVTVGQWMEKIRGTLGQIQASLTPFLIRLGHWVLVRLLNGMFLQVILHKGQLKMVHRASKVPDVPVVFLSAHKSQLDGLLLSLILASQGLGMPRVTWEYDLYSPKCRALLTRLGGVFLPPELTGPCDSEQGGLSRAVLVSCVEELLRSRQSLLIFLEEPILGAVRLSASSGDWLSLVLNALQNSVIHDVMVVPVGISYDVAPVFRRAGKTPCGFWTFLWSLCQAACRGLGCVRVDFAQPFSLQEYVESNSYGWCISGMFQGALLLPEILGKSPGAQDHETSGQWLLGVQSVVALSSEQQTLVYSLQLHSLNAGVSCSAIMAVAIMSALLLHKHQEGVFVSRLMQDFVWLTEEVLLRNWDVGFSGQVRDVVWHALLLLRCSISLHHLSIGDVLVAPRITRAAMMELNDHSASLLPVFIQEAVGACAINALLGEMLPYLESPDQLWEMVLAQEELQDKILLLVRLLPKDFLLCQPCQSVDDYCQTVVDKLIHSGVLVTEESPSDRIVCDTAQNRFAEKLVWKPTDDFADSDSDCDGGTRKCCFKMSQVENCSNTFVFFCCLLRPLLKSLERAAAFLHEAECLQTESQYTEELHRFLVRTAEGDCSFECVSKSLAAISVHIYKNLGVLQETGSQRESVLYVSEDFQAKENQEKLGKFIQQFIYH